MPNHRSTVAVAGDARAGGADARRAADRRLASCAGSGIATSAGGAAVVALWGRGAFRCVTAIATAPGAPAGPERVAALPPRAAQAARQVALGALLTAAAVTALAQQPSIVGSWEWSRKKDACPEVHVYREDGTLSVRSGGKSTENTFLMAWAPEPGGRYRLTVVTVKDDGGRDCDGSTEDRTGRQSVVYVLFSQSRESMIQCVSPSGADCTGLMRRVPK